jgi:hypothetical protein
VGGHHECTESAHRVCPLRELEFLRHIDACASPVRRVFTGKRTRACGRVAVCQFCAEGWRNCSSRLCTKFAGDRAKRIFDPCPNAHMRHARTAPGPSTLQSDPPAPRAAPEGGRPRCRRRVCRWRQSSPYP